MSITEIENEIVEEFSLFDDWMAKYEYLIDIGKSLPLIDAKYKTEDYLIKGCQSQVWLQADFKEGKIVYTADSDAIITKGIISLLVRVMSGHSPEEIMKADLSFIDRIGLKENLSPTRANGLVSMIKQMKLFALALSGKTE